MVSSRSNEITVDNRPDVVPTHTCYSHDVLDLIDTVFIGGYTDQEGSFLYARGTDQSINKRPLVVIY